MASGMLRMIRGNLPTAGSDSPGGVQGDGQLAVGQSVASGNAALVCGASIEPCGR